MENARVKKVSPILQVKVSKMRNFRTEYYEDYFCQIIFVSRGVTNGGDRSGVTPIAPKFSIILTLSQPGRGQILHIIAKFFLWYLAQKFNTIGSFHHQSHKDVTISTKWRKTKLIKCKLWFLNFCVLEKPTFSNLNWAIEIFYCLFGLRMVFIVKTSRIFTIV